MAVPLVLRRCGQHLAHQVALSGEDMQETMVTVVIPCFRSESYLESTVEGVLCVLDQRRTMRYRVVLINDGSGDGTFSVIRLLCQKHPQIVGIDLDRNYGQGLAKTAGIPFIGPGYAVFMDDDGQHDPHAIMRLVQKVDEGYDLVYAQFGHMSESGWRVFASKVHDLVLRLVTRKPAGLTITSFFALGSRAVRFLQSQEYYAGSIGYTLFPHTDRVAGVQVAHLPRSEGSSRYTVRKLFVEWRRVLSGTKRNVPAKACVLRTVLNDPR